VTALILFAIITAVASIVATLVALRTDSPRAVPRSRFVDPDFLPPSDQRRVG
jgi:hypothetical protein